MLDMVINYLLSTILAQKRGLSMKRKVRGFLVVALILGIFGSNLAFAGLYVKGSKTAPTPNALFIKGS
jgi:hypothetical protein